MITAVRGINRRRIRVPDNLLQMEKQILVLARSGPLTNTPTVVYISMISVLVAAIMGSIWFAPEANRLHTQPSWEQWSHNAMHDCLLDSGSSSSFGAPLGNPHGQVCSIDRWPVWMLDESKFLQHYYLKRPVIISNATASWSKHAFSRQQLLSPEFGVLEVSRGRSVDIQRSGGVGQRTVALHAFIEQLEEQERSRELEQKKPVDTPWGALKPEDLGFGPEPEYVFDRSALKLPDKTEEQDAITQLRRKLRHQIVLPSTFLHSKLDLILGY